MLGSRSESLQGQYGNVLLVTSLQSCDGWQGGCQLGGMWHESGRLRPATLSLVFFGKEVVVFSPSCPFLGASQGQPSKRSV